MRFTLKDYQAQAVDNVLSNLKRARANYRNPEKRETSSFSLTATTGAGKTVIAAAVLESLFWGHDEFDWEPDPGAVVLWFSDDPNLNRQTFNRLRHASEKFTYSNLLQIEAPFSRPRLDPGKVYFLNTQKLTKGSLLTRGHAVSPLIDGQGVLPGVPVPSPDRQGWHIWQTLANTIGSSELTLYLVLDEAHRGFGARSNSEKPTIVRRLINGEGGYPPIPIVWGISATIEHFDSAMLEADATRNRRPLPPIQVDPVRVQQSGLVKDSLVLDIPNEAGNFDSVLVRRAARKLKDSSRRWMNYAESQSLPEPVQPLLILQTPNTPNPDDIGIAIDTIFDEYPELQSSSIRHVFGEHTAQKFGAWEVPWIEPQLVQDSTHVRVLIAKDAISTGWDCPRAEVLVSFRPAKDNTHITQLLGRMVRNPLARRIAGDERLNAVDCILPFFDRTTASSVVRLMTGELDTIPGTAKKLVLDGKELQPNPSVGDAVWEAWAALPTYTLPRSGAKPMKRLVALAQALSEDGIDAGALERVRDEVHRALDAYATRFAGSLESGIRDVWDVQIKQLEGRFGRKGISVAEFVERADDRAIRNGFDVAKRAFGADIAISFVNRVADAADDDVLRDAYVKVTALASNKQVRERVDQDANEITLSLFSRHRVALKALSDERQEEYDEIRAMAIEPQLTTLRQPRTRIEGYSIEEEGVLKAAQVAHLHLMSDADGNFPLTSLRSSWERQAVLAEVARSNLRGWYRNPSCGSGDSLAIPYRDPGGGHWRSVHPDLIFFHEVNGRIVASIVDPHGVHLSDALAKLQALASFTEKHSSAFHRIEALAEIDGFMKVLDMKSSRVRTAVLSDEQSAGELYRSSLAVDYGSGGPQATKARPTSKL
jgi:hypothetical protein